MARSDWAAYLTEPAAEYQARTELERFGLTPYLPQQRRRFIHNGAVVLRQYPLFPRYFLLPFRQIRHTAVRACRFRITLLEGRPGSPWRCADDTVACIRQAEIDGEFDEPGFYPGEDVVVSTLKLPAIMARNCSPKTVELFSPLFGGARIVVSAAKVMHN